MSNVYAPRLLKESEKERCVRDSYRRQIEVFSGKCVVAVFEILHSREKKSAYF